MSEHNENDHVVVEKSSINIGGIIAAIALLILVLGVLKYFGVSPI